MYYRIISIFYIVLITAITSLTAVNGQSTDSLLYLLNHNLIKEDTDKLDILCMIASQSDDADTILKYSEQAIKLSVSLNISPAQPTVLKGVGYLNSGKLASALECFMQAANYYKADHSNIGMAVAYLYISEAYNQQENHNNAKYYLKNAIEIFGQEKDSVNMAASLHNLGYVNYSMGQYDTALVLYAQTNDIYQKPGLLTEYGRCLGNTGPLYIISNNNGESVLKEIKADPMPVGVHFSSDKPFANHEIQLEIGDTFYIFSDGFIDQVGEDGFSRFTSAKFKKLLMDIHDHPMYEQKESLEQTLIEWMGGQPQRDDILVIGVRI